MKKYFPKILVTGGAGFMGSEFVRQGVKRGYRIVVLDKLTYAGDLKRLEAVKRQYVFYKTDICAYSKVEKILLKERPEIIVHFAAETHVDRSIKDITRFVESNIMGTQSLINAAIRSKTKKFIHISTDEVYGENLKRNRKETDSINPTNPYAVTKAAAEFLIASAVMIHNFPAVVVRPSNNYGPWQYPEKLIPVVILRALRGQRIPVYGKGQQEREWLHVQDCIKGIYTVLAHGAIGEVYNIGSSVEKSNLVVVKEILRYLGKSERLIKFVKDRPMHDFRYCVDCTKIHKLGWFSEMQFIDGIRQTISWYEHNQKWKRKIGLG